MARALGVDGVLAIQLALTWASVTPLLPLLTGPRRDDLEPPVPRLVTVCIPLVATTAAASIMKIPASGWLRQRLADACVRGMTGLLIGTLTVHTVAVFLGAPITTLVPETMIFSILIAALTFLPVWITSNHPMRACSSLLTGGRPSTYEPGSMFPAVGCAIGAWLGAIPLCLDWEQPWQAWPLPMCVGGLVGFSAGGLLLLSMNAATEIRRRLFPSDDWPTSKRF